MTTPRRFGKMLPEDVHEYTHMMEEEAALRLMVQGIGQLLANYNHRRYHFVSERVDLPDNVVVKVLEDGTVEEAANDEPEG